MNRMERRQEARKTRRTHLPYRKHSHRLTPQRCALWVPAYGGYIESFTRTGYRVVDYPELARVYEEDEATTAALAFREMTGLRVAIRPVYCQHC
jgi:hypothetical protein